jgi:hypothetical protein
MKRNLIFIVVIACFQIIFANSQDLINPPALIVLDTFSMVNRNPNEFVKGWNWGSPGRQLDEAMRINYYCN